MQHQIYGHAVCLDDSQISNNFPISGFCINKLLESFKTQFVRKCNGVFSFNKNQYLFQ